jgi:hypothetical protein
MGIATPPHLVRGRSEDEKGEELGMVWKWAQVYNSCSVNTGGRW